MSNPCSGCRSGGYINNNRSYEGFCRVIIILGIIMITVNVKRTCTVTLTMNEEEATWLMNVLQDQVTSDQYNLGKEPEEDYKIRTELHRAIAKEVFNSEVDI
jgi:hypothetical protein